MNLICGECARKKIGEYVIIKQKRSDCESLIDVNFGNSRRRFFCFECGDQYKEGTACAAVYATGEYIKDMILPIEDSIANYKW